MGSFYTNLTVRSADTAAVESALRTLRREAAICPPLRGHTVVFDRASEEQDTEEIGGLASELSGRLNCVVLAMINHDDSVLIYELHERGKFVDHYISAPEYFGVDASERGGNPAALARAFAAEASVDRVRAILHPESGVVQPYPFESDRHEALIMAVGLPRASLGYGFDRISAGELPSEVTASDLVWVTPRGG